MEMIVVKGGATGSRIWPIGGRFGFARCGH